MSGRVVRDFRKQASKAARESMDVVAPYIKAALDNEEFTRRRVDTLEGWANTIQAQQDRNLWGRLKWLLLGS